MRILFLSPEPPYPLTGGGALRTASLLHYAAQRGKVDIVLFAVDGASDPAEQLPRELVNDVFKIPLPSHSKSFLPRAARNASRLMRGSPPLVDRFGAQEGKLAEFLSTRSYDAAIVEHFWCAPYVHQLRRSSRKVYLDLHNVESEWHRRSADCSRWPVSQVHSSFAHHCQQMECNLLPLFDGILVTSTRESLLFPGIRTIVYSNSIPKTSVPQVEKTNSIVFSGNLEYQPNRLAVKWFAGNVWPRVREKHPKLLWRILGKNPHAVAPLIANQRGIELTGPVEDAIKELARSQISIVPVLTGSGTRVKIIEAWAAALPVVATGLGAEGMDATPGQHFLSADSPVAFAASICTLLDSPSKCAQLGAAGRALYEGQYTWDAAWAKISGEDFLCP